MGHDDDGAIFFVPDDSFSPSPSPATTYSTVVVSCSLRWSVKKHKQMPNNYTSGGRTATWRGSERFMGVDGKERYGKFPRDSPDGDGDEEVEEG